MKEYALLIKNLIKFYDRINSIDSLIIVSCTLHAATNHEMGYKMRIVLFWSI